ncbi:SMP-30/gluconolactonase/LRE family protein [Nocardia sp. CA2R105]|uniref:SMP-30/gluconolactonase/LRE family protein n=1 Tax=Nocardia coffeae TaxID=2873381 RepID=UPI001CA77F08|nr:SMP-30/gluconolactonase/LRE family protein [Nocardia coffeae]MBY8863428.1 SMP-30/gluconolactonase/LRE family protein [Nocardia coffeae]
MRTRRTLTGLLTAAAIATFMLVWPTAPAGADVGECSAGWHSDTLASGLGMLENLESDGRGGFYVAGLGAGVLYHLDAQSKVTPVLAHLDSPAGLRLVGKHLYFLTGDQSSPNGTGTLQRFDTTSRTVTTVLKGLVQPNGLLLLPDGDLLITHLTAPTQPIGIDRYRPATGKFTSSWAKTETPNGLALSSDRRTVYTEDMLLSRIIRIPLDAPDKPSVVGEIRDGLFPGLDDMAATKSGTLFVAGDNSGSVYQFDPATGTSCTVAAGWFLPNSTPVPPRGPTSVRIARDGDRWALYITCSDGTLRRLRPPAGVDLTPVR